MLQQPGRATLIGLATLIIVPIASAVVMITIIGIPVGLIAIALLVIFGYLSYIVTSLLVGSLLFGKQKWNPYLKAGLGALSFSAATWLPYIGWNAKIVGILLGLGALVGITFHWIKLQSKEKINKSTKSKKITTIKKAAKKR